MALSPALRDMVSKSKQKHQTRSSNTVKLKEGKNKIRVLPSNREDGRFWAESAVHWIKPEKNGKPVAVVGCYDVYDQHCDICAAIAKFEQQARDTGDEAALELAKEWHARNTFLLNALVLTPGSDNDPNTPVILEVPKTVYLEILNQIESFDDEDTDLLSLQEGHDMTITRTGSGIDTKYSLSVSPKPRKVDSDVMTKLHDLDDYIEKQFFRGQHQKALATIASVSGVSVAGPSAAARLTSTRPVDDDAQRSAKRDTPTSQVDADDDLSFDPEDDLDEDEIERLVNGDD